MKTITRILVIIAILWTGRTFAQTPAVPYMFITQQQFGSTVTVVPAINTSPAGSNDTPTMLDFGAAFTVYVDVTKNAYSGKVLFLYIQDWNNGTGKVNGGTFQTVAQNVPALCFTGPTTPANLTNVDRYQLTIPAGQYPVLMNSGSGWTSLADGSIIRPTFYVGSATAGPPIGQGTYGTFVTNNNAIDIWGYKNLLNLTPPATNTVVTIEMNQYTPVTKNLEQMLLAGVTQPGGTTYTLPSGTYTWYMNDQYGINPNAYTVNNPNKWFNNIYQSGFKPWINSLHVDMTNPNFVSTNSKGVSCYTLYYYVIPSSQVPSSQYVTPATFTAQAIKVAVKIQPVSTPPLITTPITIATQDYGVAAAGTQWGPALPTGQTNYSYAGNYLPGDGTYSIAQDIVGTIYGCYGLCNSRPVDWYIPPGGASAPAKKYDHTYGDGTGFMYIVNASASGGVFYQNTFNVCPSMNLQFSMWLMNICNGTRQSASASSNYRIKPNVHIQIWSGSQSSLPTSGTPLLDYYTGEIPMTGIWEQYFSPIFNVPTGTSQITVFYLSVNNGGDGNDFMMDDIQVQRSNGALSFSNTNHIPCLSATDPYELDAAWDTTAIKQIYGNTIPSTFYYQWTYYAGITNPGSVSGSGTTPNVASGSPAASGNVTYSPTSKISLIVPGTQVGVYKLTIAPTSGGLSDQCAVYSYCVFSPAQPPVITPTTTQSPVCPGTQIGFSVDISQSNIPNPSALLWYTVNSGGSLTPLLNSNGNQVNGTNVTVTPFETMTYAVKVSGCSSQLQYQITVETGPQISFGTSPNQKTSGYVYRTGYNTSTVQIPVSYSTGSGNISYQVYQDSVANAVLLTSGTVPSGGTGTISFNLGSIKPTLNNFRNKLNTATCAVIIKDNTSTCGSIQRFQIHFIPDSSMWLVWAPGLNTTTPADNANWNNDANWYITDSLGNRYAGGGIPTASTNVIIPGDAANYPVLQAGYTGVANLPAEDGFNSQPACDSIVFQFGGEIAQLQYLQYQYAFIDINLGTYDGNGNFTNMANLKNTDGGSYYPYYLARDRYYSLSVPLKDMYAGDLAFGGKPNVYIKYADPVSINNIQADANAELIQKWTNSISSYNIPLVAGFGFGYEVYSGDLSENWPYKYNQTNLNSTSGLVRWPYFTNSAYLTGINPLHTFSGNTNGAGTSTFTYYPEGMPDSPLSKADVITRQTTSIKGVTVPLGNRFIVEDATNTIPANYPSVSFGSDKYNSEILVGNPFMSHLDFQQFYLKNTGTIGQYYRIWLGTAQYYSIQVDAGGNYVASTDTTLTGDVAGSSIHIAPMQSFFIPILSTPAGNSVTFDIGSMSVVRPNKTTVLRSSQLTTVKEILKITAANSRYTATAVIVNTPEETELSEGVPKLFSPSGNIPEIYLIQDYKKEIIEINRDTRSIPLGIKTRVTGETLTLKFHGLDEFSPDVSIHDAKTGITQPLTATENEFKFLNTEGNQENRFYLLFSSSETTNSDEVTDNNIRIYASGGQVKISSSPVDPIQSIKVYNVQGQLLSVADNLSVVFHESKQINGKGIYLVQIKTKQNITTRKVIIY